MTRQHAFTVFTLGFVLIAIHHIDDLILKGWSIIPLLDILPYLLIFLFWPKMKEMVLGFLLMLLGFLELNHTRLVHIPELLAEGFGRSTVTPILFDIGSVLFIIASIMIFQIWHNKNFK